MTLKTALCSSALFLALASATCTAADRTQLVVWANEAIVATYTYNYKTFEQDQKQIAHYFTADGWLKYSKALNASKLPDAVQKNAYDVSAVATQPPKLITLDPTHWAVTMPILVVYKNPQYQQQQHLNVVISFSTAPEGLGVRGFNISSLQATLAQPPCQCVPEAENDANVKTVKP